MMVRQMKAMGSSEEQAEQQNMTMIETQAESVIRLRDACGKPIVGYTYGVTPDPLQQILTANGIPIFPSPERAVAAIKALTTYYEMINS
jgi:acyl-CoA synthetase (NDP forming)